MYHDPEVRGTYRPMDQPLASGGQRMPGPDSALRVHGSDETENATSVNVPFLFLSPVPKTNELPTSPCVRLFSRGAQAKTRCVLIDLFVKYHPGSWVKNRPALGSQRRLGRGGPSTWPKCPLCFKGSRKSQARKGPTFPAAKHCWSPRPAIRQRPKGGWVKSLICLISHLSYLRKQASRLASFWTI